MENKKGINIIWLLMSFVLGTTLLKHFNFQTLKFKMPVLDIIFLIAFIGSVILIVSDYKKREK